VDVSILFGKKLVERGHIIDWILQSEAACKRSYKVEWSGCNVYVGPTDNGTSILLKAKNVFLSIVHDLKMFNILRKRKHNFILVKDKFLSGLIAIIVSKIFRTKLIYWISYPIPEMLLNEATEKIGKYPLLCYIRGRFLKQLLYGVLLPCANHVFVQSEQMKKDIALEGISTETMTVVPMGVCCEKIQYYGYSTEEHVDDKEKVVLYLGTLAKNRKLDFLVRVFEKVLSKQREVKLCFVGRGEHPSDEQVIKDEAKRLGISGSIHLTGFVPQEEAWNYVKDAHVCVSPFYPAKILNSTSPTKLIEYMAMGKAVVANDHPEQTLVLSESKAGICVPYDENAFARAIVYLLKHQEMAKAMGILGREYVEKRRSYEEIADLVETKLLYACNPAKTDN